MLERWSKLGGEDLSQPQHNLAIRERASRHLELTPCLSMWRKIVTDMGVGGGQERVLETCCVPVVLAASGWWEDVGRVREKPKAVEGCMTKTGDVPESWICLCHGAAARVDESPPSSPAPMQPTKHSSSNELPFNHVTLYTRVPMRRYLSCAPPPLRHLSSYSVPPPHLLLWITVYMGSPLFLKFVILRCTIRPPTHPVMSSVFNVAAKATLPWAQSHFKNLHLRETKP